jgi:hypothetical protein
MEILGYRQGLIMSGYGVSFINLPRCHPCSKQPAPWLAPERQRSLLQPESMDGMRHPERELTVVS